MKIKEAFSQWGLFTAFENLTNRPPPWSGDITPLLFDIRYRTSISHRLTQRKLTCWQLILPMFIIATGKGCIIH